MKLIDLLVKELPSRGGWPKIKTWNSNVIAQDGDGEIWTFPSHPTFEFGERWYDEEGDGKKVLSAELSSDYTSAIVTREQYEASVWNGEGLPPVGTEFEYGSHRSVAKCIAVSYHHVFASKGDPDDEEGNYEEFLIDIGNSSFHPVRTEAECQREKIAHLLCDLFGNGIQVNENKGYGRTWLNLYDAIAAHEITGVTLVPTVSQIIRVTEKCSREDAERIVAMLTGGTIAE